MLAPRLGTCFRFPFAVNRSRFSSFRVANAASSPFLIRFSGHKLNLSLSGGFHRFSSQMREAESSWRVMAEHDEALEEDRLAETRLSAAERELFSPDASPPGASPASMAAPPASP